MKVTVEASHLMAAMKRVTTVMSRATLPILSCVHLEAEEGDPGTLTIRATNMEHAMRIGIEATVHSAGSICVAADRLGRHFVPPEGSEVELVLVGTQLKVKAGPRRMTLPVMDPKDFPNLDAPKLEAKFELPSEALARMLDFTEFAESADQSKIGMTGVHFESRDGRLVAQATDGRQMSELMSDVACPALDPFTIPKAFIPGIRAALGGPLLLGVGDGRLVLFGASLTFVSRLLDAPFPNLAAHKRPDDPMRLAVSARSFGDALGRAIAFTNDKTSTVYLSARGQELLLHADSESGSFDDVVPLEIPFEGAERFNFAVNGRMTKAICGVAGDAVLAISAADPVKPVMIRSPDIPGLFMLLTLCLSNESNYKNDGA